MNKRYSTKPRQVGDLGFKWKEPLPHEDIIFTELKDYIVKIEVELNRLPHFLVSEKEELNEKDKKKLEFSTVTISYRYREPNTTNNYLEAQEHIYGSQDKVFNHIVTYYPQAAKMFIDTWNTAKHELLRKTPQLKSPFVTASTAQKLTEEFYNSKKDAIKFAEKLKKDKSNIYKELKGQRKISIDQAIQYSQEFGCDPVSLLFEDLTTELWGEVDLYNSVEADEDYAAGRVRPYNPPIENENKNIWKQIVKVPRDIYSPDIKAIQIKTNGSYLNNYLAYYYYSKHRKQAAHGRLSIVGQEWINDDLGIHEAFYFLGIYEEKIGGGANILNPDPLAQNKYICKDMKGDMTFISPVVSLVHPSTLSDNHSRREALKYTNEVFKAQKKIDELDKQVQQMKSKTEEWSTKKMKTEIEKLMETIKEEETLYQGDNWFNKLRGKKSA